MFRIGCTYHLFLQVYWAYNFYPNITHYDFTAYIPNEETYATNDTELLDILHHTFSPPQHMTATNGSYYLGMKLVGKFILIMSTVRNVRKGIWLKLFLFSFFFN